MKVAKGIIKTLEQHKVICKTPVYDDFTKCTTTWKEIKMILIMHITCEAVKLVGQKSIMCRVILPDNDTVKNLEMNLNNY